MSTFQPTQIANCQLWLDAAETATIQTSGGFVTQWTDRSINGRVFSPVSANTITTTTQNNLTALNFGANRMTNASFAWRSVFTTIIVAKSSDGAFLFSQQTGSTYNRYVFTKNQSLLRVTQTSLLLVDDSIEPDGTAVTASNEYFIFILGRPSGANFGSPYRVNGTVRSTLTSVNTPTDGTTTNPLWINGNSSGGSSTAEVAEILFYSDTLTTANCESLEGYLAWKWGLTANLPENHPYKNYPPQFVQPNTQVIMTNTNSNPGTLILPSTFTLPGLTYTFKDQVGAFSTNSLTLTTNNANQSIDSLIRSTINTQPLGWQTFIAGNNNRWYTVGGTLINTINTSTVNTSLLRSVNISSANMYVSSLGIIDQTLRCTTQLYVQSSFLYYSFSNQSTIISGTRQSFGGLFTPIRIAFLPNQITGLQVWLDAADVNTLRIVNNRVTQWNDKSGNGRNFSGGVSPSYITNVLNNNRVVRFASGNYLESPVVAFFSTASSGGSFFFIFQTTNNEGQKFLLTYQNQTSGVYCVSESEIGIDTGATTGSGNFGIHRGCSNAAIAAATTIANSTFYIMCLLLLTTGTSPANVNIFRNGTSLSVSNDNSGYFSAGSYPNTNNARRLILGARSLVGSSPDAFFTGDIGEVIWYPAPLTAAQRQQVEGYLAWKWGLVESLPTSHPFKSAPP
jgi:hypothetical protein